MLLLDYNFKNILQVVGILRILAGNHMNWVVGRLYQGILPLRCRLVFFCSFFLAWEEKKNWYVIMINFEEIPTIFMGCDAIPV